MDVLILGLAIFFLVSRFVSHNLDARIRERQVSKEEFTFRIKIRK